MPLTKGDLTPQEKKKFEFDISKEYLQMRDETRRDLNSRINGVPAKAGGTGKQFSGYKTLEEFYRGDQWDHNEPPGASQRTDNYCAVIIDSLSSLLFDDYPEVNCPTDDPSDDLLEILAEAKERFILRVWEENQAEVEFDEASKVGSLYGDAFIKGPWMEKNERGKWEIKFTHIENPATISPIFEDSTNKKLYGYIHHNEMILSKAERLYGEMAKKRGIKLTSHVQQQSTQLIGLQSSSYIPKVTIDEYWTREGVSYYVGEDLLDWYKHNYGFVNLEHIKNIHSPNHPYGKSDIEDILDPQLFHNRTNNDLANLLKWVTTVNLWGKNIEGMQALVAGLSRIYSLPEDGELHSFEKTGDPYIANTFVTQRRSAVVELAGVSESLLSSSQLAGASGRALAVAFQGTIRKIGPRIKRYRRALESLNTNILKLMEIYYPETKQIIRGDYRNKVYLPVTLLRNIVDTINKLQSGIISQETAMREAGVQQPKLEKKLMKKDLLDPILGPQVARQPSLLPRLSEGQNQGEQPLPAPGNQPSASAAGAVAANAQQASGAAPSPVVE